MYFKSDLKFKSDLEFKSDFVAIYVKFLNLCRTDESDESDFYSGCAIFWTLTVIFALLCIILQRSILLKAVTAKKVNLFELKKTVTLGRTLIGSLICQYCQTHK